MTGANSYLHGAHRMPAAYPDTRPAGAYDQQCGQQRTTSFRSHIPQYHSGHNHHHYHNSYGMPASVPASTPASMAASAAAGHLYPSNMAGFAHGDAASSMYLHPGDTSLSASTSPVVPPEARPIHGSSRPLTAEEKELKRKVSHSAIEKRRRERTNAVLRELQQIVPGLSKPGKIQKLEILEAAADYIRQLTADPNANQDTHAKSAQ
ncbi:Upstream stimulatory factor 1, partial [Coemansia sp. RSA 2599]